MEHLLCAEHCSGDACWSALCPREMLGQSDLAVNANVFFFFFNANVLESMLRWVRVSVFFLFSTHFPDGFSLLKVYLEKSPLSFHFLLKLLFIFLLLCLSNTLWL